MKRRAESAAAKYGWGKYNDQDLDSEKTRETHVSENQCVKYRIAKYFKALYFHK